MEQLWTELQANELESITEICGNSRLFEYRATSIEPQPQRSLCLSFFLFIKEDRSKALSRFDRNGKRPPEEDCKAISTGAGHEEL